MQVKAVLCYTAVDRVFREVQHRDKTKNQHPSTSQCRLQPAPCMNICVEMLICSAAYLLHSSSRYVLTRNSVLNYFDACAAFDELLASLGLTPETAFAEENLPVVTAVSALKKDVKLRQEISCCIALFTPS